MTTTIKAQVIRRWAKGPRVAPQASKPWAARAIALDGSGQVVRSTKTAYAASHPEALQLAQVARQALDADLMAEVHASRSRRRPSTPSPVAACGDDPYDHITTTEATA